ncbi:MAG TPA: bis(5'-nucleosyl)-tetraphosphatase (symmetrical) YqeK [Leptospiraceae bacterium]|nr:bis(5'-nucleosyl)-tetraphosphatase (symmetrical) YqeK [Leptospiraceae bacterium]HMW06996.1 bis(5'-nucleosyl)-tetraphosphatase (symmetrical) YqeK [Leptospiraceae bacterium]HMX32665.1 bis(5'-nucleosyl)-tetraphosphatase (symmetrical) YqeK [Leptospiraceae bacterium]HMY30356.1 bis(5'-nucleosyl)-tetraphosphatase (symmetrical) YqeK [Leptospiraceae bacterium]HNA07111.1 bis(5'-nucleosyl)-tetraphosphatase (symmetrical) YqeK [Leptospiraceae bacterium]
MDIEKEIERFLKIVPDEVTHTRFDHSLSVAELAEKFSVLNGYSYPRKAYLAGILHDITKQKTKDFHREIFIRNDFSYNDLPEAAYHPFSAVFYLKEKYLFTDVEILSAIEKHTLGNENLSLLDEILYVSDFLGSDYAKRQPEYQNWILETEKQLSFGVILKSSKVIEELIEKKFRIHPLTVFMYNKYLNIH